MKIIAINSSPKMSSGNTALILNPFLKGMEQSGAHVELYYTSKMNIIPCDGDVDCWLKTPGKCSLADDMDNLLPKLAEADLWVFATPVYMSGMSGSMKNLIDRMIPLITPFAELRNGRSRHPRRESVHSGKVVLVSNCGFWEQENFDCLVAHMKEITESCGREFAGALLRPLGITFGQMARHDETSVSVGDILQAAKDAGRQLVINGSISPETLQTISRPVMPLEVSIESNNRVLQQIVNQHS